MAKLNAGLNRKVTLIAAPAGFGKTTLASFWLSQIDRPSVWISLDEDDNDLGRFFTYAAAAVEQVEGTGRNLYNLLQSPQRATLKMLASALINDCTAAPDPFLLALDDYHVISNNDIFDATTFLIDHLPPQLHLLITSRTDPLLPWPRLRAGRELTELRMGDLRFSDQEAADYLRNLMGLELSSEQVAALEVRTEGWIAGLQMAALSMQGLEKKDGISAFIADFTGSHRYIFDYLTDEVLRQRPPNTRAFLLETSILDSFNASLCTAVTGQEDSGAILDALDRANLFLLPLDEKRQWYRYHHLFAAFLEHRLAQRPKEECDRLQQRAAQWFAAQGMPDQAIKHYNASADFKNIARIIRQYGAEILQPDQLNRLQDWLDALSSETIQADPWLAMLQAWIYYYEQQTEQVAVWVEYARQSLEEAVDLSQEELAYLRGILMSLRSWLASQLGDFNNGVRLAEDALAILPETAHVWRGIIYVFWGLSLFGLGRTAEAIAIYEKALQYGDRVGNWIATSAMNDAIAMTIIFRGLLNEGLFQLNKVVGVIMDAGQVASATNLRLTRLTILYERNDLQAVGSELAELRPFIRYGVGIEEMRYQYLTAKYYASAGDNQTALQALTQLEDSISSWTTPDEKARAEAAIMRIYLRLDLLEKPFDWLSSFVVDPQNLTFVRITEYLAVADIARFVDSAETQQLALELMGAVLDLCDEAGASGFKIEIYCLQALLLAEAQDIQRAISAIDRALALAEPERYSRTFIDFGQPMASLLNQAIMANCHPQYAGFLLTQFAPEQDPPINRNMKQNTIDPLSEREMDVLPLLATHLSGPEIADQLHISINTLKTHTRNIYSKLNVNGRSDAVVKARELGLLA